MIDIKMLDLFLKTSLMVKIVIIILLFFSIISWSIIIQRTSILNTAIQEFKMFKKIFWSNIELSNLYNKSESYKDKLVGSERIFYFGFKEFIRLYNSCKHLPESIIQGSNRAMNITINNEIEILEKYIPILGNIGTISPYIGLFGTVLGIMDAFITISSEIKQPTLQIVAPSIAEALITTAVGLFTAIPAVMAYNKFNSSINILEQNYNSFKEEFVAILHRQAFINKSNL